MATLRELRTALGWSQGQCAKIINTPITNYSNYENGLMLPCLEDMIVLEKAFDQRIDWSDSMSLEDKAQITVCILTLSEYYPINQILTYAQKAIREGSRLGYPASLLKAYSMAAQRITEKEAPLPPTGIKFKGEED